MYVVEFLAKIQDGTIKIPKSYRGRLQSQVRVILLSEEISHVPEESFSIVDVLASAPGHLAFHSAAEVDHYLKEERGSWDL